jgi:hypothetical protein
MNMKKITCITISVWLFASSAYAGGRYSCCLKGADGKEYKIKGIASSYYHGTIKSICVSNAIQANAQTCQDDKSLDRAGLDYVRNAQPESLDLSKDVCSVYPCKVTVHVPQDTKVLARASGAAQCSVRKTINSSVDAHTLTVTLGDLNYREKSQGSCEIMTISDAGTKSTPMETNLDSSNYDAYLAKVEKIKKEIEEKEKQEEKETQNELEKEKSK